MIMGTSDGSVLDEVQRLRSTGALERAREILVAARARLDPEVYSIELARLEIKARKPERATSILQPFVDEPSARLQTLLQMARALADLNDLDRSLGYYRRAAGIAPNAPAAAAGIERIEARMRQEQDAEGLARIIEALDEKLGADDEDALMELVSQIEDYRDFVGESLWHKDPLMAKASHIVNSPNARSALLSYDPELIEMSVRFGYLVWPRRIQRFVSGASVLDVGCGFGGYGTGFLVAGARDYTGLDPAMDLDDKKAKNKLKRQWATMPLTPREIMKSNPRIHLIQGKAEDVAPSATFDLITLHNVTEHLLALKNVFAGFVPMMHDESRLVFLHHHYYGWNGHHHAPVRPADFDLNDSAHVKYADWKHVTDIHAFSEEDYVFTGLNRMPLSELRSITHELFDVLEWDEKHSGEEVTSRLTEQIKTEALRRNPNIQEGDLTLHTVFCVAGPKGSARKEREPHAG